MKDGKHSADQRNITASFMACLLICLVVTAGCSAVSRHEILATVFDGVPSYPPPDEFCKDYYEKNTSAGGNDLHTKEESEKSAGKQSSRHQPYEEKRCDDCHDKTKEGGLVTAKIELCFLCHKDFIKGSFVHGPVAVGECLACHEPHTSRYKSLLKADKNQICSVCHREKRLSIALHDKVSERQIYCSDCHDPHYGNASNFMK